MGMSQTQAARESSKAANIEYTVYTFQRDSAAKGQERWQKQNATSDMAQAMQQAESLFASGNFCKVEIKQKYTDPKNNRVVDMTLKIFEGKVKRSLGAGAMAGLAALGGVLAFGVTYFLTNQQ
jgi:hypothetical protein